jgi:two-component system, NarL family, sensor histidine kinase UhpB
VMALGRDMRALAIELRPPDLDDLGLESALHAYAQQWTTRYGIPVELSIELATDRRVPGVLETIVYRAAKEGLRNVANHAKARRVGLNVRAQRGVLSLILDDDGVGFDVGAISQAPGPGLGLAGIRERVELAGGTFAIESAPGAGTTLFVRLPLSG